MVYQDKPVDFLNRIHFQCTHKDYNMLQFVLNMHRKYLQKGYCTLNYVVLPTHLFERLSPRRQTIHNCLPGCEEGDTYTPLLGQVVATGTSTVEISTELP